MGKSRIQLGKLGPARVAPIRKKVGNCGAKNSMRENYIEGEKIPFGGLSQIELPRTSRLFWWGKRYGA